MNELSFIQELYLQTLELRKIRVSSKKMPKSFRHGIQVGFHADPVLLSIVRFLGEKSKFFIETGSGYGASIRYLSYKCPDLKIFSCENDLVHFNISKRQCEGRKNIKIFFQNSVDFLEDLLNSEPLIREERVVFWLDAHWDKNWPLMDEVGIIVENFKNAIILIDDFKITGRPQFGYDSYQGRDCGFELISDSLKEKYFKLYIPRYEQTRLQKLVNPFLLRGFGLLELGSDRVRFPERLLCKLSAYEFPS